MNEILFERLLVLIFILGILIGVNASFDLPYVISIKSVLRLRIKNLKHRLVDLQYTFASTIRKLNSCTKLKQRYRLTKRQCVLEKKITDKNRELEIIEKTLQEIER